MIRPLGLVGFGGQGGAGAAPPVAVNAVDFDGANDFTTRGAGLTGAADGKLGLFSVWFRLDGGDALSQLIFRGSGNGVVLNIKRGAGNLLGIDINKVGGMPGLEAETLGTFTAGADWKHLIICWDMAVAGSGHMFVEDVEDYVEDTFVNADLDYTGSDWAYGARQTGADKFNGCLAEMYFALEYLDISITANRRKFITAGKKPVDLGADGSTPTGTQPIVYFKNVAASVGTNSGSGGNFTITGAPVDCSDSP